MMKPLLIVRPEKGAEKTAVAAKAFGLTPVIDPLFRMEALSWDAPPPAQFDALLLTSANAVHYAGTELRTYWQLPVFAVGQFTADAAEIAGFEVSLKGNGGVDSLLSREAAQPFKRLLHLTGKHYHKSEVPDRCITRVAVYDAAALPLGVKARKILNVPCVVMLHSARAAQQFSDEVRRVGLNRTGISIAGISDAVVQQAGTGWADVQVADMPKDDALLTVAERLCRC